MAANWGLFLCSCRQTLCLDPEKLVLPTVPSVLFFASEPETQVHEFAARAKREPVDRVLIGCCAAPALFAEALRDRDGRSPRVHFIDLKEACFGVHPDPTEAHAKAFRLLRAAMETSEAEELPGYNPLKVGGRVLIATDMEAAMKLAERLQDVAKPFFVVAPSLSAFLPTAFRKVHVGKVIEVRGRLGDFRVTVEEASDRRRRELEADQVVIISRDGKPSFKPRTGCHLLVDPGEADLDRAAEKVRDLIGEFLKPVHVGYNPDICAGGTAGEEACGICITACPYDAISRDPENQLRIKVDQMACEGCGACVSACPTTSLRFTEPAPQALYSALAALLRPLPSHGDAKGWTILFHCGEQGRRVLEEAGRRPLPYPATLLPVEVPCLRYVSEANILGAFRLGAAGVGLLGCEICQHGERELLYQKLDFCRLTLDAFGIGSERLRLITAQDGTEAQAITALSRFSERLEPSPIRWDGQPMRHWGNREVIADAIRVFIEETGKEPGQRVLDTTQPFAFADVAASGCTMCRSCVNVCPTHAFALEERTQSLQLKHIACVACGLCEKVCPEKVITLRREIYFDRDALEYQTVVEDNMVSCAKCGKPYINRRALETVEARVFSLPSLFDTFGGGRRNLLRMCPDCRAVVAMLEVEKGWKP